MPGVSPIPPSLRDACTRGSRAQRAAAALPPLALPALAHPAGAGGTMRPPCSVEASSCPTRRPAGHPAPPPRTSRPPGGRPGGTPSSPALRALRQRAHGSSSRDGRAEPPGLQFRAGGRERDPEAQRVLPRARLEGPEMKGKQPGGNLMAVWLSLNRPVPWAARRAGMWC